jgi:hypothetical protein
MRKLATLLDRGRELPGVQEGTHTGTLHELVRARSRTSYGDIRTARPRGDVVP